MNKDQIEIIKKKVAEIERTLADIKRQLGDAGGGMPQQPDYSSVEGTVGRFDGVNMVTADGAKYEVPANYSAKSKLVFGDTLKLIEENGKQIYKHIDKVPRQRTEGILSKKDGLWYVLTDRGSYKVSDVAAEFQKAEINTQVKVLLPAENLDAPFATIDEMENPNAVPGPAANAHISSSVSSVSPNRVKPPQQIAAPAPEPQAQETTTIGDDDLV